MSSVFTVKPELMTTSEYRSPADNGQHFERSEQRSPVNNGHYFWVPRVDIVHRLDCILNNDRLFNPFVKRLIRKNCVLDEGPLKVDLISSKLRYQTSLYLEQKVLQRLKKRVENAF